LIAGRILKEKRGMRINIQLMDFQIKMEAKLPQIKHLEILSTYKVLTIIKDNYNLQ
jgi:hypothetical protein